MHFTQSLLALVACCSLAFCLPSPGESSKFSKRLGVNIANAESSDIIPNKYVVVFNSSFTAAEIDDYQAKVINMVKKRNINKRHLTEKRFLSTSVNTMAVGDWKCMSLEADDATINELAASNEVSYVEADVVVKASRLVQQTGGPAGLARISHAAVGSQNYVFDDSAGAGVTVYVVDTGVRSTHSEFSGRAVQGANFIDNVATDQNGHGSHVSGTVAGTTMGVAKRANIVGVKVLGADGSGSNSGVLQGLDFGTNLPFRH